MIAIKIKNDEISRALAALSAHMADMTVPMTRVGQYLIVSTKERFAEGVSPEGAKWAPKSPTTLAAYGARKTNRMDVRPLFGPSLSLSTQFSYDAKPDSLEFGSPMIYAAMQQFGGTKAQFPNLWGNIPARPFLGISDKDETNIVGILAEWAEKAAAGGA